MYRSISRESWPPLPRPCARGVRGIRYIILRIHAYTGSADALAARTHPSTALLVENRVKGVSQPRSVARKPARGNRHPCCKSKGWVCEGGICIPHYPRPVAHTPLTLYPHTHLFRKLILQRIIYVRYDIFIYYDVIIYKYRYIKKKYNWKYYYFDILVSIVVLSGKSITIPPYITSFQTSPAVYLCRTVILSTDVQICNIGSLIPIAAHCPATILYTAHTLPPTVSRSFLSSPWFANATYYNIIFFEAQSKGLRGTDITTVSQ